MKKSFEKSVRLTFVMKTNTAPIPLSTQTLSRPRLSPAQVEQYSSEGYLIIRDQIFPIDKFNGLQNCFEDILSNLPEGERPEGMDVPHFIYPQLFQWLLADETLDLVEPFLGPDIALFSSHFICKPKGNGKRVPWHEDSSYWRGMLDPMEVVTIWLAIDPSTLLNGCMKVIPRTHTTGKMGFSDYDPVDIGGNVFPTEITKAQRDDSRAVPIEIEAGQASLHDGRIMHGSEPNTSSIRRCGYTMRFISAATKFNVEKHGEYHHIYLARGRDRADNTYGESSRTYPEKSTYRIRSGKQGH